MRNVRRVAVGAVLGLVLLLGAGCAMRLEPGLPGCDVTIQRGQSIQQAIDQAAEGAVICLKSGTFRENLTLSKSLSLRGAGRKRTILKKFKEEFPHALAIRIGSDVEIEVALEDLTIADPYGIEVGGKAKVALTNIEISGKGAGRDSVSGDRASGLVVMDSAQVSLTRSRVSNSASRGLYVRGEASVTLTDSTISDNQLDGLHVEESARVSLTASTVSGNESHGLLVFGGASVSLINSTVSGNGFDGLVIDGSAQVSLIDSTVSDNGLGDFSGFAGLWVRGSARVSLSNSRVSGNRGDGLFLEKGSATVEVQGSTIEGNGTHPDCYRTGPSWRFCNGIEVWDQARLTLIDSVIQNNTDWGLAVGLILCGYAGDNFTGLVVFEGKNVIKGNNRSGNQSGKGNPGSHSWSWPDVPDGQVCLP